MKISELPIINTIFGPLFKGQNVIVEWDLEEEDSFSLEYLVSLVFKKFLSRRFSLLSRVHKNGVIWLGSQKNKWRLP